MTECAVPQGHHILPLSNRVSLCWVGHIPHRWIGLLDKRHHDIYRKIKVFLLRHFILHWGYTPQVSNNGLDIVIRYFLVDQIGHTEKQDSAIFTYSLSYRVTNHRVILKNISTQIYFNQSARRKGVYSLSFKTDIIYCSSTTKEKSSKL